MPLALYAAGFNAFGQLTGEQEAEEHHPPDLQQLECILTAENTVRALYLGWSDTLLQIDEKLIIRGSSSSSSSSLRNGQDEEVGCDVPSSEVLYGFGDEAGLKGVVSRDGEVLLLLEEAAMEDGRSAATGDGGGEGDKKRLRRHAIPVLEEERARQGGERIGHLAVAGNGKFCVSIGCTVIEYPSLGSMIHNQSPLPTRYTLPAAPLQLLANETSFTALVSDPGRSVYTWGDGRHNHLGRVLRGDTPANVPHMVDHLGGISVKKIATGGWITAAVSLSRDLYIWGGRPGEENRIRALPDVSRAPEDNAEVRLVDIEEGLDVCDVAVGAGHVVALTADGSLWAVGRDENGQLGCGSGSEGEGGGKKGVFAEEWVPIRLAGSSSSGRQVERVERLHCGPCCSLVVVRTN